MKNKSLIVNRGIVFIFVLFFTFFIFKAPPVYSQTASPTVTPTASDPLQLLRELLSIIFSFQSTPFPSISPYPSGSITPLPTESIGSITDLVNNINLHCSGYLNRANIDCLEKFYVHPAAKTYLINSVINYYFLQCADFAKALVAMTTGVYIGSVGSAMNMIGVPPTGFEFIPNDPNDEKYSPVQVGDLPVWDYDTFGHTGFVTNVIGSDRIEVAEANYEGHGFVRIDSSTGNKSLNDAHLAGWVRKIQAVTKLEKK